MSYEAPIAKNNQRPVTPGTAKPIVNPEQLTRDIEGFLADKQTAIAESIDQLLRNKKEIDRKSEEAKKLVDVQADKLNELYHKATGRYYLSSGKAGSNGSNGATGGRRSKEELEADAKAIVAFVQTKGKDGVSGAEIKAQFSRITGSIKAFVKKYTGFDLKTEGSKSHMRYFGEQAEVGRWVNEAGRRKLIQESGYPLQQPAKSAIPAENTVLDSANSVF